jgi:hypothetical protein
VAAAGAGQKDGDMTKCLIPDAPGRCGWDVVARFVGIARCGADATLILSDNTDDDAADEESDDSVAAAGGGEKAAAPPLSSDDTAALPSHAPSMAVGVSLPLADAL